MRGNPNIRRPIPQHQSTPRQPILIDDEFRDIINRECPGKLHKLIRQKAKCRFRTQPVADSHDDRHSKIFERTFYKERQKAAEKDQLISDMKLQLKQRLKAQQRPPSPFFKLSRASLLGLQRSSLEIGSSRFRSSSDPKPQYRKSQIHPYIRITEKTTNAVSFHFVKTTQGNGRVVDFSPFGVVEPVDIQY